MIDILLIQNLLVIYQLAEKNFAPRFAQVNFANENDIANM